MIHDDAEESLKDMRERCFRAIRAMDAQRRPGPNGYPSAWIVGDIMRRVEEAYGYTPEKFRDPTPKDLDDMLPVMGAIARYISARGVRGARDYKILVARAYNIPWHRIADRLREDVGERTLARWLDSAVEEIIKKHLTEMSEKWQQSRRA